MHRDVVVIGGSAGAVEPLKQVAAKLPPDLPAAVVVVVHIPSSGSSALGSILNRAGGIPAVIPRDGDPLKPGYIYVPTPDRHLEVKDGVLRLTAGPRVNGVRPAVDVLFRSAASSHGPRVIGVVLSGGLDDGSGGLMAIRAAGGVGIVQSPDDAMTPSMPKNAIEAAHPEHVVRGEEIGALIGRLVREPVDTSGTYGTKGGVEMEPVGAEDAPGQVTGLTCPDCHGSIWLQSESDGSIMFACRIGHSYSPETFFDIQSENVENALWAGVRSLEEQVALSAAMASRAQRFRDTESAKRFEHRGRIAQQHGEALRTLLVERSEGVQTES